MKPRKLYNFYFVDGSCRIWLRLVPAGEDLEFEEYHDDEIGSSPEWLNYEVENVGYDSILDISHKTVESGLGWCFVESNRQWALKHGLAPRQPFLVHLYPAEYTTTYEGESDVFFSHEFIKKAPLSDSTALKRWGKEIKEVEEYRFSAKKAMKELVHKRKTDVSAMYIQYDSYWPRGYSSYSFPNGFIIKLCTRHQSVEGFAKFSWCDLAEGRDDNGNREKAWQNLIDQSKKILPDLTEEQIKTLPIRRI